MNHTNKYYGTGIIKTLSAFLLISILLTIPTFANAQSQAISLKEGFNFVSFTIKPTLSPIDLKQQNSAISEIYTYSASSGSFLSISDGTLLTLNVGKGYIVKTSAAVNLNVAGSEVTTIGNINLKTGFNLIGISKNVAATKFSETMTNNFSISGIYKWSAASGSFIQVVKNLSGITDLLDGLDPAFTSGQSYFINMKNDATLNYDNGTIAIDGGSTPPPVTITSISPLADIKVAYGTAINTIYVPTIVSVTMSDNTSSKANVLWLAASTPAYNRYASGTYVFTGDVTGTNLKALLNVIVGPKPEVVIKKVFKSFTLSKTSDTIKNRLTPYNLSSITGIARYDEYDTSTVPGYDIWYQSSTKEVNFTWTSNSPIQNNIFIPSLDHNETGAFFTATYTENNLKNVAYFNLFYDSQATLNYISVNPKTITTSKNVKLGNLAVKAVYSDSAITNLEQYSLILKWEIKSGISGKILYATFFPDSTGTTILTLTFTDENGISKSADLTINTVSTEDPIESNIDGNFQGWSGSTIFKLKNGQVWKQNSYGYASGSSYNPQVTIRTTNSTIFGYEIKVEGSDQTITVDRLYYMENWPLY